jgi:ADP-heptose:LPS heptosyltransferase
MTTPVIRALKMQLGAEIHFLTKSQYEDVLEGNLHLSKVHILDGSVLECAKMLRKARFDLIVDLHRSIRSRLICFLLGVKYIVIRKQPIKKWLFLKLGIDRLHDQHVIDRTFQVLGEIGVENDDKGMEFHIADKGISEERDDGRIKIAMVVGGTYPTKRLPVELCRNVIEATDHAYYLLGGNDAISTGYPINDRVHNFIGKVSLHKSASILHQCHLVVSGDTGLAHVAAALNKPIILVWGSTSPKFGLYPYFGLNNPGWVQSILPESLECWPCSKYGRRACPKGHMDCLTKISANQVLLAMNQGLSQNH